MDKINELRKFIKKLKKQGFQVFIPKDPATFCYFVRVNKIGYVELTDYGFNFSTVHKPNRSCGTGYSIHREDWEPTVQKAIDCLIYKPSWAGNNDIVNKYKNWEDYLSLRFRQKK